MAKSVAKTNPNLPDHLQGLTKTTQIGNIDSTDLIIPRVKLLQALNPELDNYNDAKRGEFWHTIASRSLGAELRGVPIITRKTYVLWAPRGDDRGVLARASDGVHWDEQYRGLEFTVKPKNSPHDVTYKLGDRVSDSVDGALALSDFGSSIPGDDNSQPAAALTYNTIWYFPDHPELSPAIILNTRSSVKPMKDLLSKLDMQPVDHYHCQFLIKVTKEDNDGEPFYNYAYQMDGFAEAAVSAITKAAFERYDQTDFAASDEGEDTNAEKGSGEKRGKVNPEMAKQF